MLRGLLVMLALVVAVGAAHADTSVPDRNTDPTAATDASRAKVGKTEKRRAAMVSGMAQLQSNYQDQLAQIDSLKQQKASWRRDRQLKSALASSLDTANKLAQAGSDIAQLDARLLSQRKALLAAIDAEVAGGATGDRATLLARLRAKVDAQVSPPKKIVIPDDEIDPLADPDELDQQAQALQASEAELQKQVDSLDADASRFTKQANLKKAHDRAGVMASRDDDQPRRTSGSGGGGGAAATDNPTTEQSGNDPAPPTGGGDFAGDPAIVLSDVVDPDTEDSLRKAELSTDPAAKAAAAAKARDAVAKRLAALKQRRQEIEERAKALRQ